MVFIRCTGRVLWPALLTVTVWSWIKVHKIGDALSGAEKVQVTDAGNELKRVEFAVNGLLLSQYDQVCPDAGFAAQRRVYAYFFLSL